MRDSEVAAMYTATNLTCSVFLSVPHRNPEKQVFCVWWNYMGIFCTFCLVLDLELFLKNKVCKVFKSRCYSWPIQNGDPNMLEKKMLDVSMNVSEQKSLGKTWLAAVRGSLCGGKWDWGWYYWETATCYLYTYLLFEF